MEIAYTMGVQDWIASYRTTITYPRRPSFAQTAGALLIAACLMLEVIVFYHGYARAWHRQHSFPWHFIRIALLASAAGPAAFTLSLWSLSSRRVTLERQCVTIQSHGKVPYLWLRVSGIFQEPEHIIICFSSLNALVIPRRAFVSEQAATKFFEAALDYWHEAKGTLPPAVPDVSGVWPPAPRPSNSAEPGDTQ